MPILRERWRGLRFFLCLISAASAIACIVMPSLGVQGVFNEFQVPYSMTAHARILAEQLAGPVYTLLVVLPSASLSLLGRQCVPWWSWLLGVIGPIYTVFTSGMISHDFSHTLFQECSGIYGEWISGICIVGGGALAVLAGMAFNEQRGQRTGAVSSGKIDQSEPPHQTPTPSAGNSFLRLWIPAGAVFLGFVAFATGCYTQFRTLMVGTSMILYGAAFIAIGVATFGFPVSHQIQAKRLAKLRLRGGLALGAAMLIASAISMVS